MAGTIVVPNILNRVRITLRRETSITSLSILLPNNSTLQIRSVDTFEV